MDGAGPVEDDRRALGSCKPFDELAPELVDEMFRHMTERRYEPGEPLIRQGDPGDSLLVILEGSASMRVTDGAGTAHELGGFGAGEVVGEMALVTREPRSTDVVASAPVRARALPAEDFHRLAARHPELGMVLTRLIGERLGGGALDGLGGKIAAGYQIVRCVGRGGMAIVYEARRESDGARVALKMMSHTLVYDSTALSRFRMEAEVIRELAHENIARLYDRFSAFGTQFLVLEYCDGPPLTSLVLGHGPLPESAVRPILGQLARALDHVHRKRILHRDLKPGNVLMTSAGIVKLSDFGMARPDYSVGDATRTSRGAVLGTPAYMPLEQLEARDLDARADIYGLACIACELLTGQPPFRGRSIIEIARAKLSFKLPAAADLRASPELHALIEAGLRNDPAERLASVEAFLGWAAPCDLGGLGWRPDAAPSADSTPTR